MLLLRRLLIFFLFVDLSVSAFAQRKGQALIDSIKASPGFLKQDTNKVKLLINLAQTQLFMNPVLAIPPAQQALALSKSLHWRKGEANSLNTIGFIVGDTGNNSGARTYFEQAVIINRADQNNFRLISNLNNIGRSYSREGNFSKALEIYLQAMTIAENTNDDEQISVVGTGLIAVYLGEEDYEKAKKYARITIEHGERAHAMANVGTAELNVGRILTRQKDSAAARMSFSRALNIYRELGNRGMVANAMEYIAEVDLNDAKKALPELLEVRKILDSTAPRGGQSMSNFGNIGICYEASGDAAALPAKKKLFFDSAVNYMNRGLRLAEAGKYQVAELEINHGLASVEEKAGRPAMALKYFKKFGALSDSIYSQDKKNQIAGLQGKHDLELKDKEIAISKLEVNNQHLLVNAQKKTQIGLLVSVGLLAVIGGLLFWQSRQRKKTNTTLVSLNGQLDEANKVKARFFGILSHDLRGPISNLLSFLHLVKEEPGLLNATEQEQHKQQIGRSAEELLETMESMLLWSKEQMDDFKPNIRLIPVTDLFTYLEKFFGSDQRAPIRFSNMQNLSVSGDENYLRVIMQNLTANALKALNNAPNGLIEWQAKSDGGKTILVIKDNGPGMNREQAKALYQGAAEVNARSGFGFHLMRDLAKAIRYTISVESAPGVGTTFTLAA